MSVSPVVTGARRYRAFICYSQSDGALAARLHRRLEEYRPPQELRERGAPASLAPIFRDREELQASADIGERLRAALADSEFLIVLCSPAAAQSKWVDAEIDAFRAASPGNASRVLAAIVAGEPQAGDPQAECFPPALRGSATAGALHAAHPLAADFRAGKDVRRDAELRLIAALLGVEFDALRRREQERKVARLRRALAAALCGIVLFAGLAAVAWAQWKEARLANTRAERARLEAIDEAAVSRAIGAFLRDDLLAQAAPERQPDRDIKLRTVLEAAAKRIDGRFEKQPGVEAEIRTTIGDTFVSITDYAAARHHLERALHLFEATRPAEDPKTLQVRTALTTVYVLTADYAKAEPFGQATLALQERALGPRHPLTLQTLGRLGGLYQRQAKFREADATLRRVLFAQSETLGPDHFDTISTSMNLGALCYSTSKTAEAETLYRSALERLERTVGRPHPTALKAAVNLALVLQDAQRLGEAEALLRETTPLAEKTLGAAHETTLGAKFAMAGVLKLLGKYLDSESLWREAHDGFKRVFRDDHPLTLAALQGLASVQQALGKWDAQEPLLRELVERKSRKLGPEHPGTLVSLHNLGNGLLQMGRLEEAEKALADVVEKKRRVAGKDSVDTLNSAQTYVRVLMAQKRWLEAAAMSEELAAQAGRVLGADHVVARKVQKNLGEIYFEQGRLAEAERVLADLVERAARLKNPTPEFDYDCGEALGEVLLKGGRFIEAEVVLKNCLEGRSKRAGEDWGLPHTRSLLGAALAGAGRAAEAGQELERGYRELAERRERIPPIHRGAIREAGIRWLEFLRRERPDEFSAWEKVVIAGERGAAAR